MANTLAKIIGKESLKYIGEKAKLVYLHQLTIDENMRKDDSGCYDFVYGDGFDILETSGVALCATAAHALCAMPIAIADQNPNFALYLSFILLPFATNASVYLIRGVKEIYKNGKLEHEEQLKNKKSITSRVIEPK